MTEAAAPLLLGGSPRTAPHLPTASPTQPRRLTPTPDTLTSHFTHHHTPPPTTSAGSSTWPRCRRIFTDACGPTAALATAIDEGFAGWDGLICTGVTFADDILLTGPSRWATHPRAPNPATDSPAVSTR